MPKQPATVKNAPLTLTTGRRKAAVARVWLRPGSGQIKINGREVTDYFPNPTHRQLLTEVWGPQYADATPVLRTHIANLRSKLQSGDGQRRLIRTDSGIGYRLSA